MGSTGTAKRIAKLVVDRIPSKYECSEILKCLLEELGDLVTITLPNSGSAGFVVASQNPPDPGEAVLWIELNGAGVPVSFNYFIDGSWQRILNLLQTAQWRNGNYLNDREALERAGYVLMNGNNGTADLTDLFTEISSNPVNYSTYAVAFVGRQILSSNSAS